MKGHFIDFIKGKWINILKYKFFTIVKVHETNFNKFFKNKMATQNFSTASSAGPLTIENLQLDQKTRKILKIYCI